MTTFWNLVTVIGAVAALGMGPGQARAQDRLAQHKERRVANQSPIQDGRERRRTAAAFTSIRGGSQASVSTHVGNPGEMKPSAFSRQLPNTPLAARGSQCSLPANNCQDRDYVDANRSDRREFFVAEDFVPATDGAISQLCWQGGYFDFGPRVDCHDEVTGNRFQITYFADDGGMPGDALVIFTQEQLGTPLTVFDPVRTGALIANRVDEFEYTATHAGAPVPVQAGECYWVEISNLVETADPASTCVWVWETSGDGNERAMLDNDDDGYDMADAIGDDLALCLDVPLGDPSSCVPPPPANDMCAEAEQITDNAIFAFDNTTAGTDGNRHALCQASGENQIEADVWYCWTAPCTDVAVVWSCDLTDLDTRIAVYDGCAADNCPPTDADLLACNDDRCGSIAAPRQSLVTFNAVQGSSYLIRVGLYPGARRGAGSFSVSCGPPPNANCPGAGDCCDETVPVSPSCDDEACCALVCLCDPYCCGQDSAGAGYWDETCAMSGWPGAPDCGAQTICEDLCDGCGDPAGGDCCTATPDTPGCSDQACCAAVCAVDSFCCEDHWDESCSTIGVNCSGAGAQVLCPDLCGEFICPDNEITWLYPPNGVVDARQPHPPYDAGNPQGIDSIVVGTLGCSANINCWTLCDTSTSSPRNEITNVLINSDQTLTIQLLRPITPGAVTTLTYEGNGSTARFTSHPGNVNGDGQSNAGDITAMVDMLNGVLDPPWGTYSADVDHSGMAGPADILRVIDLLTGGGAFAPGWNDSSRPTNKGGCP